MNCHFFIRPLTAAFLLALLAAWSRSSAADFVLQSLATFSSDDDGTQPSSLLQGIDGFFYGTTTGSRNPALLTNGLVFKVSSAGEFSTLAVFPQSGTNGLVPDRLVQAPEGTLYGAASRPGSVEGIIFKLTQGSPPITLHTFNKTDGRYATDLLFAENGALYGATPDGGAADLGTVFRLLPDGEFRTLFEFSRATGINPRNLIHSSDGTLYGTTADWVGINAPNTVFKLTPSGQFTNLVSSVNSPLRHPAALVLGRNGSLYGADGAGGSNEFGTIFQISSNGAFSILAEFNGTNGWGPDRLLQSSDGNLYGTTAAGGGDFRGRIPDEDGGFRASGSGTIFQLGIDGKINVLANRGSLPGDDTVAFFEGPAGVFYGARRSGAPGEPAGVFRLSPRPTLLSINASAPGGALAWSSFSSGVYQVESSSSLGANSWFPLANPITGATTVTRFNGLQTSELHKFFRVRLLP